MTLSSWGRMITVRDFPPIMSAKDFARAYGVSTARISQLRGEGLLPATLDGSGDRIPRWDREVVFRYLARQRRDEYLHGLRLSLLYPRTGVSWHLAGRRTIEVPGTRPAAGSDVPLSVHVMTYRSDAPITGQQAVVHLVTALAPHSSWALESVVGAEGVRRLAALEALLAQLHPRNPWGQLWEDRVPLAERVALVLLETIGHAGPDLDVYRPGSARFRTAEVSPAGLVNLSSGHDLVSATDIAATLGHELPWWPDGHTSADLVAAWKPEAPTVTVTQPPFAEDQYAVLRWTSRAATAFGAAREDVLAVGEELWQSRTQPLREFMLAEGTNALQVPAGWVRAVRWELGPATSATTSGDVIAGADAVLGSARTPRQVAQVVASYLGDPAVFDALALPLEPLESGLRRALLDSTRESAIPAEASWRLFGLQQRLIEVGVAPDRMRGAHWHRGARREGGEHPREPEVLFGEDLDGRRWMALHPPRVLPAELSAPQDLRDRGVQLRILGVRDEGQDAVYLLQTDDGLLVPLPIAPGDPARAAWWLARIVLGLPLPPNSGGLLAQEHPLVDVLRHAAKTPTSIPWSSIIDLAADARPAPL